MYPLILFFLTFASLICFGVYMETSSPIWLQICIGLISIVISVASFFFGVYKIINHAFNKRDKQIGDLIEHKVKSSDQIDEFESHLDDFKTHTNNIFQMFTERMDRQESDLKAHEADNKAEFRRIDDKLNEHSATLARIEQKLDDLLQK